MVFLFIILLISLQPLGTDRGSRVSAMRTAILETFPEPNRKLLQR